MVPSSPPAAAVTRSILTFFTMASPTHYLLKPLALNGGGKRQRAPHLSGKACAGWAGAQLTSSPLSNTPAPLTSPGMGRGL